MMSPSRQPNRLKIQTLRCTSFTNQIASSYLEYYQEERASPRKIGNVELIVLVRYQCWNWVYHRSFIRNSKINIAVEIEGR